MWAVKRVAFQNKVAEASEQEVGSEVGFLQQFALTMGEAFEQAVDDEMELVKQVAQVDKFMNFGSKWFDDTVKIFVVLSTLFVKEIVYVEEEKIYVLDTLQHDKHYYTTVIEVVNQDKCNISEKKVLGNKGRPIMFKDLRNVWELFKDYDQSNTVLIDDSAYKSDLNHEHTSIITKSFVGVKDDYLGKKLSSVVVLYITP
ncbi:putative FCP1 homology domain-containing protein C1271.03c-like [Senna tora]|uniref:Putative FCP1 homology domain-containing protein C1271.03c-like n=1 Tax=Senna tora TaxID=362788 RepID=A0A834TIL9_9FABA|nr:putative FCP1 homology domain-containing protein C1271.03c-like [Senna tora]